MSKIVWEIICQISRLFGGLRSLGIVRNTERKQSPEKVEIGARTPYDTFKAVGDIIWRQISTQSISDLSTTESTACL